MVDFVLNSTSVHPDRNKTYKSIVSGKGVYLYDNMGKEYLDAVSGKAAVASLGHGNESISEAIYEQMKNLTIFPTYCFDSPLVNNYCESLINYCPKGFAKAWLVTSGSEAVENACKFTYQYHCLRDEPQRIKFIGRQGSYHGNSIIGLDVGGTKYRKELFRPLFRGYRQIPAAHCYRCPFNLKPYNCELECAKSLESTIIEEGPETIAAFIVEPVAGAALGASPSPEGYLMEIRRLCDKYGILMIADEVMSGFGRTGKNFAIDHWNVIPDIIAAGKGIGSGYYPIAAIMVHERVIAPFEERNIPFASLYSYACNTMAAVAGNKVLDFMKENNINSHVSEIGKYMRLILSELKKYPIVGDIRGLGLLLAMEFVINPKTKEPFSQDQNIAGRFADIALENGLIVYPCKGSFDGYSGDHILLTPPLIITKAHANRMVDILDKSISQLMKLL